MAKTYRNGASKRVRNMYAEKASERQRSAGGPHNDLNRRKNVFNWQDEVDLDNDDDFCDD